MKAVALLKVSCVKCFYRFQIGIINQDFPWPAPMLLPCGNLTGRYAVVDPVGGYAEQPCGLSDRYALPVSFIRAGNIIFITDPPNPGICEGLSLRGNQPVLVQPCCNPGIIQGRCQFTDSGNGTVSVPPAVAIGKVLF